MVNTDEEWLVMLKNKMGTMVNNKGSEHLLGCGSSNDIALYISEMSLKEAFTA